MRIATDLGVQPLPPVAHDRAGMLETARRLLEPYLQQAAGTGIELGRVDDPRDGARPFAVSERRRWRSILVPIHLQLLEAYRRVMEGQAGAYRCRECGQPFLALDARRTAFCTDRERFRHSQRERRQRLKTITVEAGPDDERLEAQVEEHIRNHPSGSEEPEDLES